MPQRSPVGAHVFVAGGLHRGLSYAERIGAEAVQVFVSNPRGWKQSAGDPKAEQRFRDACGESGWPVFVHAPYLVNFGSPTTATCESSAECVRHSLSRGAKIGARAVVVHAGSAVDATRRPEALRQLRELLLPILDSLSPADPDVLIEPTAGGGSPLAARVEDLAAVFSALDAHPRLGVCLDTCHLFAAGHDVAVAGGMRRTLDGLRRAVGRDRLRLVHANDSKDPLGSGRDRHANIGTGLLGPDTFRELFAHRDVAGVPVLIETSGDESAHRRDLEALRAWRDAAQG